MLLSNKIGLNILAAALMIGATLTASAPDASANPTPSVHWMKLHDGLIAFDDSGGNGPIVICVPGLGDLRQQYRFLAPRLASKGFRVITMDVRGHGASSVDWPDYSAAAVGADIVALINSRHGRSLRATRFLEYLRESMSPPPWLPSTVSEGKRVSGATRAMRG